MKLTKTGVMALVLGASAMSMLTGCETLTESPGQNRVRMARAIDTNAKQAPDDLERILLVDKPSTLTDRPVPIK